MFAFYKKWKKRRLEQYREDGYNWAAGSLLKGGAINTIMAQIYPYTNDFDLGASDACDDFQKLISSNSTKPRRY